MRFNSVTKLTLAVAFAASPMYALAQDDGQGFFVRAGVAHVAPNDDSDGVIGDNGLGLIPGNDGVNVESDTGLAFSVGYGFGNNWAVNLLLSAPFEHGLRGEGAIDGLRLGETHHLPPSLVAEYQFNPTGKFRPYVAAGINYTWFYDTGSDPALTSALDGIIGGVTSTDIDLDNSFGPALNVGFDYMFNDNWGFNAQVWYLDIDTEADVIVNGARATTVDVDVDPWVAVAGFTYRF